MSSQSHSPLLPCLLLRDVCKTLADGSRKQVNKFLSALSTLPESHTSTPTKPKSSYPPSVTTSISVNSSTQHFDAFISSISRIRTIGEARRMKVDIERESRNAKMLLEKEESNAEGSKDSERSMKRAKRYVGRLERARNQVDAKIDVLAKKVCFYLAGG